MSARASRGRLRLAALGALIAVSASLAACGDAPIKPAPTPVKGEGNVVTEDRTQGEISRISVGADVDLVMRTGSTTSVTIEGEPNVIPLVQTETRDGQLIVNVPSPGYVTTNTVKLTVTAPSIESVTLSAGASGSLEAVSDTLRVDLSGGAQLLGVGRAEDLQLTASSNGVVDFTSLVAGSSKVNLSGGALATLTVEQALTGQATGGATIVLTAQPKLLQVETSSGASVQGATGTTGG